MNLLKRILQKLRIQKPRRTLPALKVEDVAPAMNEVIRKMEDWFNQPSIIWEMVTRRSKSRPTVREAAMEAETLLTNYLANDHFPKGSDCEEVRDMLRRALGHRVKPIEKVLRIEVEQPGLGKGVYGFHMVESNEVPEGTIFFLPRGIAEAINRGDAKILKV
jgi:hypothetical protein